MVLVGTLAAKFPPAVWPVTILLLLIILVLALLKYVMVPRWRFVKALQYVPGPRALPILGNALILTGGQDDFFRLLQQCSKKFGDIFVLWVGQRPFVFLHSAHVVQPILNSTLHIDKSYEYSFLFPWVGTGLVTSTGPKWHARRKLLTPSFHSKILDDFAGPVQRGAGVFVQQLAAQHGKPFDIYPLAKLCALDLICDTAMGRNTNAQLEGSSSAYANAISRICAIMQRRFITPWLKPDVFFNLSSLGREQARCLNIIHGYTNKVIAERREELKRRAKENGNTDCKNGTGYNRGKPRLALLDMLLELSQSGVALSDEDIQNEVNTFLFAGHDTTGASISWCLFVFGSHPEVQERIVEEVKEVLKDCPEGALSFKSAQRFHYLEACIKEVMRLYPVVPIIARDLRHEVQVGEHTLPPGVTILINLYLLHRDPRYFPEPDRFIPERFMGDQQSHNHPFAYIPFSAGSRNCIGQKFAMLELKVILAMVLLQFCVHTVTKENELNLLGELVLLNKEGITLRLTPRHSTPQQ